MTTTLPNFVIQFLIQQKKLHDLEQAVVAQKAIIEQHKPEVDFWLRQQATPEIDLDLGSEMSEIIGHPGKLHFVVEKRKEYLSREVLNNALFTVLQSRFSQLPIQELQELASMMSRQVWLSRKVIQSGPVLRRSFRESKRKRTASAES